MTMNLLARLLVASAVISPAAALGGKFSTKDFYAQNGGVNPNMGGFGLKKQEEKAQSSEISFAPVKKFTTTKNFYAQYNMENPNAGGYGLKKQAEKVQSSEISFAPVKKFTTTKNFYAQYNMENPNAGQKEGSKVSKLIAFWNK
jgi:hypothetical protein